MVFFMKMFYSKRFIASLLVSFVIVLSSVAQENQNSKPIWDHGDNVSSITYQNVQVYKIYDAKDAYVVVYAKSGIKVGQVSIPKDWAKTTPRKLEIRNKPVKLSPYMTVIKQNGEFLKVWLTVPLNKLDSMWGVLPNGAQLDDLNKESLEIEY